MPKRLWRADADDELAARRKRKADAEDAAVLAELREEHRRLFKALWGPPPPKPGGGQISQFRPRRKQ